MAREIIDNSKLIYAKLYKNPIFMSVTKEYIQNGLDRQRKLGLYMPDAER